MGSNNEELRSSAAVLTSGPSRGVIDCRSIASDKPMGPADFVGKQRFSNAKTLVLHRVCIEARYRQGFVLLCKTEVQISDYHFSLCRFCSEATSCALDKSFLCSRRCSGLMTSSFSVRNTPKGSEAEA